MIYLLGYKTICIIGIVIDKKDTKLLYRQLGVLKYLSRLFYSSFEYTQALFVIANGNKQGYNRRQDIQADTDQ
jgi:hypothetical protein